MMDTVHCCSSQDSSKFTCTHHQRPIGKWEVDCEGTVGGVEGSQAVKRYSMMDPGQDSSVLCLHKPPIFLLKIHSHRADVR